MNMAIAKPQPVTEGLDGEPFAAFVTDPTSREIIVRSAAARNWPERVVEDGDILSAIQRVTDAPVPSILIVEFDKPERATLDVTALAQSCGPETAIIGLGTINDVELYRELIGAGLTDYLVKPVNEDALDGVLDRAIRITSGDPDESKRGKVITVIGARGGVGASTLGLSCAWLMAHEQNLQTALLDLDLYFGTSALSLDLLPGRGLREALENPDRIDSLLVASVTVNAGDRLFILAGEEPLEEDFQYDLAAFDQLLNELRRTFSRVVIDLPRSMALSHRAILIASSVVVIVADHTLPALRDTVRLRSLVGTLAPQARILVVGNNVASKSQSAFSKAEFERGLEARLDHIIPHDRHAFKTALYAGKTVPQQDKRSKTTAALRGLANDMTGMQPLKQRGGFLRRCRLFGR